MGPTQIKLRKSHKRARKKPPRFLPQTSTKATANAFAASRLYHRRCWEEYLRTEMQQGKDIRAGRVTTKHSQRRSTTLFPHHTHPPPFFPSGNRVVLNTGRDGNRGKQRLWGEGPVGKAKVDRHGDDNQAKLAR